jgi:hypothetical protein
MSLNISEANHSGHGFGRAQASANVGAKRQPAQVPDGADAAPKPKSLSDDVPNPLMRTHPTASTDDSLQRLPESSDRGRVKARVRKEADESGRSGKTLVVSQNAKSPYDPPLPVHRTLDLLA